MLLSKESDAGTCGTLPQEIQFEISEADITDGIKGSPSRCPIARAIKRHFPNTSYMVLVGKDSFSILQRDKDGYTGGIYVLE